VPLSVVCWFKRSGPTEPLENSICGSIGACLRGLSRLVWSDLRPHAPPQQTTDKMGLPHALPVVGDEVRFVAGISDMREILRNVGFTGDAARFRVGVVDALGRAHGVKDELRLRDAPSARSCYELAQEWLANAGNGRPTVNRTNRGIRILMQFFSQVHNTL